MPKAFKTTTSASAAMTKIAAPAGLAEERVITRVLMESITVVVSLRKIAFYRMTIKSI